MISRHCLIEAELVEQRTLVVVLTPHHRPSPTQNIVRRRNQCSPKPSNHFCNKIGTKRTIQSRLRLSASLIGRSGSSAFKPSITTFQTIHHCSVDVAHGLVLLFGNGTR